ncbi:unnamed protein product, partial [Symbiodinium necroappetens]
TGTELDTSTRAPDTVRNMLQGVPGISSSWAAVESGFCRKLCAAATSSVLQLALGVWDFVARTAKDPGWGALSHSDSATAFATLAGRPSFVTAAAGFGVCRAKLHGSTGK